jgi:hypothetical protein
LLAGFVTAYKAVPFQNRIYATSSRALSEIVSTGILPVSHPFPQKARKWMGHRSLQEKQKCSNPISGRITGDPEVTLLQWDAIQ